MAKYRYIGICALLFTVTSVSAQFEKDYTPVEISGILPKEFTTLTAEKVAQEISKDTKTHKKENYFKQSSYYSIDNLLLSGHVLFNEPLSIYVNKVADALLANDKATRNAMSFYVLQSTQVNAFATHQGAIFITTGLLARLHNEAELAFVLAHEAIHYKEKHAIREYMQTDKIDAGKGTYRGMMLNEKKLQKCIFSQEQEKESDAKGLQIFLNSAYSTEGLSGIYDVLKYSQLPFDTLSFKTSFFENGHFTFPDKFTLKQIAAIDTADADDDEYSSHPGIKSRRAALLKSIEGISNEGKGSWLVSEAEFKTVKEIARMELCRLYLLNTDYERALYHAYIMLHKYPDNFYLQKITASALTELAVYSGGGLFSEVHNRKNKVKGNFQAVCHFTEKLDSASKDFCVVALAYVNKLLSHNANDVELKEMYAALISTLTKKGVTYEALETPTIKTERMFARTALQDYMKDDQLRLDFRKYQAKAAQEENMEVDIAAPKKKKGNYFDTRTFNLGIDKITVVDPFYTRMNANKKEKLKYIESENGQLELLNRMEFVAKHAKLNLNILSTKNLKEGDVDKLKDIGILDEYLDNRLSHPNTISVPYFEREKILALAKKYGTDNFMWTGVVSLTDKNLVNYGLLILAIMYPVTAPFILPAMINGGNRTFYYALVYDVKTDKIKLTTLREIQNRTTPTILNSHIYDVLNQIKTPAK